ncbi:MAG: hypothetical protein PHS73_00345 [Candidatus Peribacteraceae bacterium]|nr:hypothetical protein [Candidatus Peribacteraceae bacterium]
MRAHLADILAAMEEECRAVQPDAPLADSDAETSRQRVALLADQVSGKIGELLAVPKLRGLLPAVQTLLDERMERFRAIHISRARSYALGGLRANKRTIATFLHTFKEQGILGVQLQNRILQTLFDRARTSLKDGPEGSTSEDLAGQLGTGTDVLLPVLEVLKQEGQVEVLEQNGDARLYAISIAAYLDVQNERAQEEDPAL